MVITMLETFPGASDISKCQQQSGKCFIDSKYQSKEKICWLYAFDFKNGPNLVTNKWVTIRSLKVLLNRSEKISGSNSYHQSNIFRGVEITIRKCRVTSLIGQFLRPHLPKVRVDGVVFEPSFGENSVTIAAPFLKSANSCKIFKSFTVRETGNSPSYRLMWHFSLKHKTFSEVKVKEMREIKLDFYVVIWLTILLGDPDIICQ